VSKSEVLKVLLQKQLKLTKTKENIENGQGKYIINTVQRKLVVNLIENHFKFRVKYGLEKSKQAFKDFLMSESSPNKVTKYQLETANLEELR